MKTTILTILAAIIVGFLFQPKIIAGENDVKFYLAVAYRSDFLPGVYSRDMRVVYYDTNTYACMPNEFYYITNKPFAKYPPNEYSPTFVMVCQYTGTATNKYRITAMKFTQKPLNIRSVKEIKSGVEAFPYLHPIRSTEVEGGPTWVAVNTWRHLIETNAVIRLHSVNQDLNSDYYKSGIYKVIVEIEE